MMVKTDPAQHSILGITFDRFRSFNESAESVLFFARCGVRVLRCFLTRRALIVYFGARDGDIDPSQDCLLIYDRNVGLIQDVASRLIAHCAQPRNGVIVIRTHDVFRHLTTNRSPQVVPMLDLSREGTE